MALRPAVLWPGPRPCRSAGGRVASVLRALHGRVVTLCRDTMPYLKLPFGHNITCVLRYKIPQLPALLMSRYNRCIVTLSLACQASPVMIQWLYRALHSPAKSGPLSQSRYTLCIVTHSLPSHSSCLSHDTIFVS